MDREVNEKKNPGIIEISGFFVVGRLGFEPGMTEPKPVVLPLHHRPIAIKRVQRYKDFGDSPNIYLKKCEIPI